MEYFEIWSDIEYAAAYLRLLAALIKSKRAAKQEEVQVTRWRLEKRGGFPKKVQLTERCVGWPEGEIIEWLNARAEER